MPPPADAERTVVLVEGVSDRRALAALDVRLGRPLHAAGVEIVSMDGVTNLRHALAGLRGGPAGSPLPRVLGLFDVGELPTVVRMLLEAGFPGAEVFARPVHDVSEVEVLERLGFFACVLDLEDELIRAVGADLVEEVLLATGELDLFRKFQNQPAQRERPVEAQLRRFAGTTAGRKLRFAEQLVDVLPVDRVPSPLLALVEAAVS
ncbi:ATP-dependent endonuclease [Agromyces protaetiae]|uniref:ATP-dependent endonuclease n=1 Tax=Agromyces protaetiae TaxID=2509455 RepID=A0A4P6F9W4_9MICO|nr:TOPRIM nucleotidyl transferase/hydrolase domain-containing protein [Agromyces protaetiae]QAY72722.1 ATP-dependent endonuclease [Agromyces protaetiae]